MNVNIKTLFYFDPNDQDFEDHIILYKKKINQEKLLVETFS